MNKEEFFKKMQERSSDPLTDADKKVLGGVFEAVRAMTEANKPMSKDDLDAQIRETIKSIDGAVITEDMKTQIRESLEAVKKIDSMQVRQQIEDRFNLRKMLDDKKESILDAIKNKREIQIEFQARDAKIHRTDNVATSVNKLNSFSDNTVIDNEIALIRYPENFILNMISNRQVSKVPETILAKKQKTREGEAEIVEEGGLKPLTSYTFDDKIFKRVKAAAHMEFTEEFEMDFERLYLDILDLFERDVMRDYQDKVLDQIIAAAPAYVATAMDGQIVDPDMYAVIGACMLSLEQLGFNANNIAMHPSALRLMQFAQDKNGNYKLPPIMVGERQVAGLTAYPSTKVDPGKILMGDSSTWREEHTSFITRMGWINEQFIHNEKAVIGEVFFIMRQHDRDKGSWIYADIAAVKAALQKAA